MRRRYVVIKNSPGSDFSFVWSTRYSLHGESASFQDMQIWWYWTYFSKRSQVTVDPMKLRGHLTLETIKYRRILQRAMRHEVKYRVVSRI